MNLHLLLTTLPRLLPLLPLLPMQNRTRSFEFDADTPLEGALDLSLSSLNQGAGSAGLPKPHTPGSASSAARNLSAAFGSAHDSVSTPTGSPGADAGFGSTQGGALAALTPVATHGGGGGGGGLGLEGMRLGLACDCVVSVQVANRSDRYFRVWLGRVADTSDGATPGVGGWYCADLAECFVEAGC